MIQEYRRHAVARCIRERVPLQDFVHLCCGADDDPHRLPDMGLQPSFKSGLRLRCAQAGPENRVSAGNVRLNSLKAGCLAQRPQLRHRELAGPADVHGAKKSDERHHRQIIRPRFGRFTLQVSTLSDGRTADGVVASGRAEQPPLTAAFVRFPT
jgi:hypothetical protein